MTVTHINTKLQHSQRGNPPADPAREAHEALAYRRQQAEAAATKVGVALDQWLQAAQPAEAAAAARYARDAIALQHHLDELLASARRNAAKWPGPAPTETA